MFSITAPLFLTATDAHHPPVHLTDKETEVLTWSARGKSSWEIARILGCSEAGVNFHFCNIRRKFQVNSRHLAAHLAISLGLIQLDDQPDSHDGQIEPEHNGLNFDLVIADDHPMILWAAQQLLEQSDKRFTVVDRASSPEQLLGILARRPCDLLCIDYCMPSAVQPDGLALIGYLKRQYPGMKVLVMTMLNCTTVLRALLKLGVEGLLDKHRPHEELLMGVRTVTRGQTFISETFQRRLQSVQMARNEEPALSPRESEVMRLLGRGLSGRDVARMLNRSEKTISRQKRNAMEKLGLVPGNH